MSKSTVTSREYSFRKSGRCTKFSAHVKNSPKSNVSHNSTVPRNCKNCSALSIEIEKLRRQVAILTSQLENQSITGPLFCEHYEPNTKDHNVSSAETQTGCIEFTDACCGSNGIVDDKPVTNCTSAACGTDETCHLITLGDGNNQIIWPYNQHDLEVFDMFDVKMLGTETTFSHSFSNRSVAYYGSQPYSYNGGYHPPQPFSSNKYLNDILIAVGKSYPGFRFNSAMVTNYANGEDWMPLHSDNEACIVPNSSIMTISFGETRTIVFQSKDKPTPIETEISLAHGDVLLMSQQSQSFFQHTIPKDTVCKRPRISITLRLINFNMPDVHLPTPPPISSPVNNAELKRPLETVQHSSTLNDFNKSTGTSNDISGRSKTLFISSSMFKSLDERRLSSKTQDAVVFAYPGATVSLMEEKFKADCRRNDLDPKSVQNIVLMCGTNNVDLILKSPKHLRNKLIYEQSSCSIEAMSETFKSIENFLLFLREWAPYAKIKLLNILPRESSTRNDVINRINNYISSLADKFDFVHNPDTEFNRLYLFASKSGFRKSIYFSSQGSDNVHLNQIGIIRFARYLKYIAHNH